MNSIGDVSMCSLFKGLDETEIFIITPRVVTPSGLTILILTFLQ